MNTKMSKHSADQTDIPSCFSRYVEKFHWFAL